MQLYLDSYGASLGVKNGMFCLKTPNNPPQLIAIRRINVIFATKGVNISTNAMLLAIQNNIPLILLNNISHPVGQVWSGQFGSISTIRKNQALFARHPDGLVWIKNHLCQKIEQQIGLLQQLTPHTTPNADFDTECQKAITIATQMKQNLQNYLVTANTPPDAITATFRGWEGIASRHYFKCISMALPTQYQFGFRSRHPSVDEFNSLLNYLYGILYAVVELALMKAGIDPYTGIMHADEYNHPTMVYDFIEIFRYWADAVAIRLCQTNALPADGFDKHETKGVLLGTKAKGVVVNQFFRFMNQLVIYQNLSRKRITHIDLMAIKMATMLKEFDFDKPNNNL
jgi:CRISPR-associated protein Cas1